MRKTMDHCTTLERDDQRREKSGLKVWNVKMNEML